MNVRTVYHITVNGALNEQIHLRFDNHDGGIGIVFVKDPNNPMSNEQSAHISIATARQLYIGLQTALAVKKNNQVKGKT